MLSPRKEGIVTPLIVSLGLERGLASLVVYIYKVGGCRGLLGELTSYSCNTNNGFVGSYAVVSDIVAKHSIKHWYSYPRPKPDSSAREA